MNLKESLRHATALVGITIGGVLLGSRDQAWEPVPTPTPTDGPVRDLQFNRPKYTLAPTSTATPTPTPEATPTKTPKPEPKPTATPTPPPPAGGPEPTLAPIPTQPPPPPPTPTVGVTREPSPTTKPEIKEGLNYEFADEVIRLTNEFRKENDLPPLNKDERIMRAAQKYAQYCFENCDYQNLDHFLDGSPDQRLAREGYLAWALDEVMDGEIGSPQDTLNSWLNSPSHRTSLLHTDIFDIGTGCYQGPYSPPGYPDYIRFVICVQDMASEIEQQ